MLVTVVLAVRCSDGVVIGSDSQITNVGQGMSYPAQKLHPLGETAAWGGSGARAALFDLQRLFNRSADAILESDDVGRALQERVLPVLRHHYDHFIEHVPGQKNGGSPATYVLAAGYGDGGPWIIEIDPSGMVTHHEEVGFHAIGSGAPMAQQAGALLAHFQMHERSVEHGVVVMVRVLDALSLTSPSVGGGLDVCRITGDGAQHLDDGEIDDVRKRVARWAELEQQALDALFD
jgi:20S proteasome alpha/beta subunit